MRFRVQFLDASSKSVAEWAADAFTLKGALDLVEGLAWPPGAVRMQVLDADGRLVHWRAKERLGR
jgi:hypothetical protein